MVVPAQPHCVTTLARKVVCYPLGQRPLGIFEWVRAVKQDPSLLGGAWALVLDTDMIFFRPTPVSV